MHAIKKLTRRRDELMAVAFQEFLVAIGASRTRGLVHMFLFSFDEFYLKDLLRWLLEAHHHPYRHPVPCVLPKPEQEKTLGFHFLS